MHEIRIVIKPEGKKINVYIVQKNKLHLKYTNTQ